MNKIEELEQKILRHKSLYYQGHPEIEDHIYDALEDELKEHRPDSYVLSLVGNILESENKVAHDKKMLSLDKTYDVDILKKWMKGHEVVSTFKVDGVSCSLLYREGKLDLAKTRGDGAFGENITEKVKWMESIPKTISITDDIIEVRGELYCNEESFYGLSDEMEKVGEDRPSSQRNIVAGLICRKEKIFLNKFISFKAFEFLSEEKNEKTEVERHHRLDQLGFETVDMTVHNDLQLIDGVLNDTAKFMSEGEFLIDGLVLAYNSLDIQDELGATAHHPRYKMAFKFKGESKVTTLKDITWQVSRNGYLTPVGEVEPIELSGAMISRVTLHNFGMVKQYRLKVGDKIEIIRSGEVIPKFLSVSESSENPFAIPEVCPSCQRPVKIDHIRLICVNDRCPDKVKEGILNFIQKIGIDDLSSKRLEEMIRKGLVEEVSDLYDLTVEQLLTLDKTKEKLANKLIEAIQNSKLVDVITFLSALGISGGAYNKCEKVVRAGYDTIAKLKLLSLDQLMAVDSFAEKSSTEFLNSIRSKFDLVDRLVGHGFNFEELKDNSSNPIYGKKICITGSLSEKRTVIESLIRDAGGVVVGSVSKNTDILLTNETEIKSSKYKKAKSLEIQVVNEPTLLKLLE